MILKNTRVAWAVKMRLGRNPGERAHLIGRYYWIVNPLEAEYLTGYRTAVFDTREQARAVATKFNAETNPEAWRPGRYPIYWPVRVEVSVREIERNHEERFPLYVG